MKNIKPAFRALVVLSLLSPPALTLLGQGSLTPSGPPTPIQKTLDQIEPRTPISSAPFTITNSGAYVLTTNVVVTNGNAITIGANNVRFDLNGFTIRSLSSSASGRGVSLASGVRNVTVSSGFIVVGVTNSGGAYAYPSLDPGEISGDPPVNARVVGVSVPGCLNRGINLIDSAQDASLVESCMVQTVGG